MSFELSQRPAAPDAVEVALGKSPTQLPAIVDVRNAALVIIAVLASLVVLKWAAAVFIPLLFGLMLSYALTPAVNALARYHVPRALGALALLSALVGAFGSVAYWRSGDAVAVLEALPAATQKLHEVLGRSNVAPAGAIDKVQQAAEQLEQATKQVPTPKPSEADGVTRVRIERRFDIGDYVWTSTLGLAALLGQVSVVLFVAYFLLSSGDAFRRKLVRIAGPTLSEKRITVKVLDEITQQIQAYLLVQLAISAVLGLITWLLFLWLGLEHAAVWGIAAGTLNLIPYLGAIVIAALSAMLALLQFGTIEMALAVSGSSLAIHLVIGNLLTPWLTGRIGRMHPVVVFVGVLAWGWLWGISGLLLGIPILMVVKALCDRVEDLKPVGEMLGS